MVNIQKCVKYVFPSAYCHFYLCQFFLDFVLLSTILHGHVCDRDSETSAEEFHETLSHCISLVLPANL